MKFITAIFSTALCIAIAAPGYTQSLAEIANKEKKRREQIDKKPDVITNDTQLPADFFIKLPGLSLSAGFSISFFLFNRNSAHSSAGGGTP